MTAILERDNFIVYEAALGKRLLEILDDHAIDLILLDMRLPDANGLELIQLTRQKTDIPIIVISGEKNKAATVSGLYLGADDHILKPFDIDELIARIKANLRRYRGDFPHSRHRMAHGRQSEIAFAGWRLDYEKSQLFDAQGRSADLTAHEFALLEVLLSQAGRVLKRTDLCEAIRMENYVPTPRAIDLKIMRIRKKIGDDATNPHLIKTVRGVGYVFEKETLARSDTTRRAAP